MNGLDQLAPGLSDAVFDSQRCFRAAMQALSQLLGRRVGPSTGTNFVAMLELAGEMRQRLQEWLADN